MENIEYRKSAIDAADCIGEGWNFLKPNYGLFLGMAVIEILITIAASFVPYAGSLMSLVVGAALTCGVYMCMLQQRRGESVPFSLMFEGFSRIVPISLVRLIGAIPLIIFGAAIASLITALPQLAPDGSNVAEIQAAIFNRAFLVPFAGGYLVVILVSSIFSILLFFAVPLIAERNDIGVGDALRLSFNAALSNFGGLILLFMLEGLVIIAGALVCCIGIIFVLPIVYAANVAAFKRVFPSEDRQFNREPPRPEDYGGTYGTPQ